jgi:prepilin-type processing-associated H-X9-DG protein
MPLNHSPLLIEMGTGGSTNMFRCPLDTDDTDRVRLAASGDGPYLFSYEMTSFNIQNNVGSGITTIIDGGKGYYFKSSLVRSPSQKVMVAEPVARLVPTDEPAFEVYSIKNLGVTPWVAQCGRFEAFNSTTNQVINFLTVRHNKNSNATFVDGHSASVSQMYATNLTYLDPTF